MTTATAFKPEYIEHNDLSPAIVSACLSSALDDAGCTDKQVDLKAHRILAKAVYGDYKIVCWWAAEQEEAIHDGKPMNTVDKQHSTLLGICAVPRTGKTGDVEAIARINTLIKAKTEHYMKSGHGARQETTVG